MAGNDDVPSIPCDTISSVRPPTARGPHVGQGDGPRTSRLNGRSRRHRPPPRYHTATVPSYARENRHPRRYMGMIAKTNAPGTGRTTGRRSWESDVDGRKTAASSHVLLRKAPRDDERGRVPNMDATPARAQSDVENGGGHRRRRRRFGVLAPGRNHSFAPRRKRSPLPTMDAPASSLSRPPPNRPSFLPRPGVSSSFRPPEDEPARRPFPEPRAGRDKRRRRGCEKLTVACRGGLPTIYGRRK
jgi:hypothetical protein